MDPLAFWVEIWSLARMGAASCWAETDWVAIIARAKSAVKILVFMMLNFR